MVLSGNLNVNDEGMKDMKKCSQAKRDQIHIRSASVKYARQIQAKTGESISDIVDKMIEYAYQHVRFDAVQVVTRYRLAFEEDKNDA